MPPVKANGSLPPKSLLKPTIKNGTSGGKGRPTEGKMFPRGKG